MDLNMGLKIMARSIKPHLVFCILRGPHRNGHGHFPAWCGQRRLPKAAEGSSDQQQRKEDCQALSHQMALLGWNQLAEQA